MPYKDPEDRKKYLQEYREQHREDYNAYMRDLQQRYRERQKAEAKAKDKKIIELQKTINHMRLEHYPDLPLIKIGE